MFSAFYGLPLYNYLLNALKIYNEVSGDSQQLIVQSDEINISSVS